MLVSMNWSLEAAAGVWSTSAATPLWNPVHALQHMRVWDATDDAAVTVTNGAISLIADASPNGDALTDARAGLTRASYDPVSRMVRTNGAPAGLSAALSEPVGRTAGVTVAMVGVFPTVNQTLIDLQPGTHRLRTDRLFMQYNAAVISSLQDGRPKIMIAEYIRNADNSTNARLYVNGRLVLNTVGSASFNTALSSRLTVGSDEAATTVGASFSWQWLGVGPGLLSRKDRQRLEAWAATQLPVLAAVTLTDEDGVSPHPEIRIEPVARPTSVEGVAAAVKVATPGTLIDLGVIGRRLSFTSGGSKNLTASLQVNTRHLETYRVGGVIDTAGVAVGARIKIRVGRTSDLVSASSSFNGIADSFLAEQIIVADGGKKPVDLPFVAIDDADSHWVGVLIPDAASGSWIEAALTLALEPDTVAIGQTTVTSEIRHHGVVYRLDAPRKVGRYADGSYWVLNDGGVGVVAIDPASRAEPDGDVHGAMRDWGSVWGTGQGFDGRAISRDPKGRFYDETLNVDPGKTGTPIALAPGEEASITKAVSLIDTYGSGGRETVDFHDILTIVTAEPAPGDFRPWTGVPSKTSPANIADLDLSVLPSLKAPAGSTPPSIRRAEGVAIWPKTSATFNNPADSTAWTRRADNTYGREAMAANEILWAALCLDHPPSAKRRVAIAVAQHGLDLFALNMRYDPATIRYRIGGANMLYKEFVVFAAVALNRPDIRAQVDFEQSGMVYPVDGYIGRVVQKMLDTPRSTHQLDRAKAPFERWHLGMPYWAETVNRFEDWSVTGNPYAGANHARSYLFVPSKKIMAMLAMRKIRGAMAAWNNQTVFDYFDRHFHLDGVQNLRNPVGAWPDGIERFSYAMWIAHRAGGAPVAARRFGMTDTGVYPSKTTDPNSPSPFIGDAAQVPELVVGKVGAAFALDVAKEEFFNGVLVDAAPDAYRIVAGALPAGLALSPTGVIEGVPLEPGNDPFTEVTVRAENTMGAAEAIVRFRIEP